MKLKRHRTSFHSLTIEAVPAHFQNIYLAAQAITTTTINRIKDEDTILIYGRLELLLKALIIKQ